MQLRLQREPNVRAEAEALKRTWELLDYLPRSEPSPTFTHRTLQRVSATCVAPAPRTPLRYWRSLALGMSWAASVLVAGAVGYSAMTHWLPREPSDDEMARDLRLIENKRLYERVEDLDFLRQLDDPDLFGD